MRGVRSRCAAVLRWLLVLSSWACDGPTTRAPSSAPAATAAPARATANLPTEARPQARLELGSSPYQATLVLAGSRPALLTTAALHWLDRPGTPPVELPGGELAVGAGGSLLRYSSGALRRLKYGESVWSTLLRLPQAPRMVAGSGDNVAWLQQDQPGEAGVLWSLVGAEPRRVAMQPAHIVTMSLRDDRLFFAEELPGSRWRLGVAPTTAEAPRYSTPFEGRSPAMLVVTSDLFYYDGPRLSVERVSTDLRRTERIAQDVICSPLAVAQSVFCAQPGGLLEVPLSGGQARPLASPQGTVTALLATASELFWLREAAGGGLIVEAMSL